MQLSSNHVRMSNVVLVNSPFQRDELLFIRLFREANLPEGRFNFLLLDIFEFDVEYIFQLKIKQFIDFIYTQFLFINGGMEVFITEEDSFTATDVITEFITFCKLVRTTLKDGEMYLDGKLLFNGVWFNDNNSLMFARIEKSN